MLEKVLDPNKAVSDQYAATIFTLTDGRTVTGRIVDYHDDNYTVMLNMLDPAGVVELNARKVEAMEKSKVSVMPAGLLDSFKGRRNLLSVGVSPLARRPQPQDFSKVT